jgi:hypothetical protein
MPSYAHGKYERHGWWAARYMASSGHGAWLEDRFAIHATKLIPVKSVS